MTDIKSKKNY